MKFCLIRTTQLVAAILLIQFRGIATAQESHEINSDSQNHVIDQFEWLDEYLAVEMGYSEEQIKQFKSNVAVMSEKNMRSLLRRLKRNRGVHDAHRISRFIVHNQLRTSGQTVGLQSRAASYRLQARRRHTNQRVPRKPSFFSNYFAYRRLIY